MALSYYRARRARLLAIALHARKAGFSYGIEVAKRELALFRQQARVFGLNAQ